MTYEFTSTERAQILQAMAACTGLTMLPDGSYERVNVAGTNVVPLYQALSSIIAGKLLSPSGLDGASLSDLKSAKLWLDVAIGANSNTGMHSEFIRTYTNLQGRLRLGRDFTLNEMQAASNAVGRNVANGLLRGDATSGLLAWSIPRIDQIASLDASAIGSELFDDKLTGNDDTAITRNAAWSGTIGFDLLGGGAPFETWRLISSGNAGAELQGQHSEAKPDTLDDFKNVLYSVVAYNRALLAGYQNAGEDFLSYLAISQLYSQTGVSQDFWHGPLPAQIEVIKSSGNVMGFLSDVVAGTPIAPTVGLIGAIGANRFLDMLRGALQGKALIGATTDANFEANARVFFDALTPGELQSISTKLLPTDAEGLVALAKFDVNVRAALAALSVVSVQVGSSIAEQLSLYDAATGDGAISDEWLHDRAAMTSWVARGNWSNTVVATGQAVSGNTRYLDQTSGAQVLVGAVANDQRNQVYFGSDIGNSFDGYGRDDRLYGGAGSDTLNGQGGNDYLEGGAGDDSLIGGEGQDTLLGGAGVDNLTGGAGNDKLMAGKGVDVYRFEEGSGHDVIDDSDGQGLIQIDGIGVISGSGSTKVAEGTWQTADKRVSFTLVNVDETRSDLYLTFTDRSDVVVVQNWAPDRNVGISLPSTIDAPTTSAQYQGDRSKDVGLDALTYLKDSEGNYAGATTQPGAADVIIGSNDGDEISGMSGNDGLSGMAGDDRLLGGDGDDLLLGGAGEDTLLGGDGNDLIWGAGRGWISRPDRSDFAPIAVDGTELSRGFSWVAWRPTGANQYTTAVGGFDAVSVEDLGNVIDGGAGNDTLFGGFGDDVIDGGADKDQLMGLGGADSLSGGADDDIIWGDGGDVPEDLDWTPSSQHGNDLIQGGAGNDTLIGQGADDVLYGGAGNDDMSGDGSDALAPNAIHGNDYLDGGDGNDDLVGNGRDDTLFGGAGNDRLWGDDNPPKLPGEFHGADYLDGEDGDDYLEGGGNSDEIFGGTGNDTMWGDAAVAGLQSNYNGDDYLDGEAGDDILIGGGGADTLWGGSGADYLRGDDSFVEASNEGADYLDGEAGDDTLYGDGGNDELIGGDGLDMLEGGAGDDQLFGDAGDDQLVGGLGNDTLVGGEGTDYLAGGAGNDRYVIKAGESPINSLGQAETLVDSSGENTVVLEGIRLSETTAVAYSNGNLGLNFGAGQRLIVVNAAAGTGNRYIFDDAVVTARDIINRLAAAPLFGVDEQGHAFAVGGSGNDSIGAGAYGPLSAGFGTYSGGLGNDYLQGAGRSNTYLYGLGDGRDTIDDATGAPDWNGAPDINVLVFGPGITLDSIRLASDPYGVRLLIGADQNDQILLWNGYGGSPSAAPSIGRFVFDDGSAMNFADLLLHLGFQGTDGSDNLLGSEFNDRLEGHADRDWLWAGAGDDILNGGDGIDYLSGGAGNDTLDGGAGADSLDGAQGDDTYLISSVAGYDTITDSQGNDRILFAPGIGPADVQLFRDGTDLRVLIRGGESEILIKQQAESTATIEQLVFADETVWNWTDIQARMQSGAVDVLTGTAGDDTFTIDNALDVVQEQAGQGNDTVLSSVSYTLSDNLENLTLSGVLSINAVGNALDNVLRGNTGSNAFGNSQFALPMQGSDTYIGGAGDDTYYLDADSSSANWTNDTIVELDGEGDDTAVINTYSYTLPDHVENLVSEQVLWNTRSYRYLTGNASNNRIDASGSWGDANVWLDGGEGSDTMRGGIGNDIYVVDHIGDVVVQSPGIDAVRSSIDYQLAPWLTNLVLTGSNAIAGVGNDRANRIEGQLNAARNVLEGGNGDDTYVLGADDVVVESVGAGTDTVELDSGILGSYSLAQFANVENLTLGFSMGNSNLLGNAEGNMLVGNLSDNRIEGGDGNDTINGDGDNYYVANNNDTLVGGAGDDLLISRAGSDVFDPGSGNDVLRLQEDAFGASVIFGLGSGHDRLTYGSGIRFVSGFATQLHLGAGITPADIQLSLAGTSLVVTLAGGADSFTIERFLDSNGLMRNDCPLDFVEFADGTRLSSGFLARWALNGHSDLATAQADALLGTAMPDSLSGQEGDDILFGLGGNDTLLGDDGNDQLNGNSGSDQLEGGAGDDLLVGGAGDDSLYGASGQDTLQGGDGNDTLSGGAGSDTLEGGGGADSILFSRGDGSDSLSDVNGATLVFGADIAPDQVRVDGYMEPSTIYLNVVDTSDYVRVENFLLGANQISVRFADGTVWDAAKLAQLARTLTGTSGDDYLYASGSDDLILGLGGADTLDGGGGNDTLDGGTGNDTMIGGAGNDTYRVDSTSDVVYGETSSSGIDTIETTVTLSSLVSNIERLTLIGSNAINGTGNSLANVLTGNAAVNTLSGAAGNDTLDGGAGNDTIDGGAGNDVVLFGVGDGRDTMREATADSTSGKLNVLRFKTGVAADDVTVVRVGTTLEARINGTNDVVVVTDFYYNSDPNSSRNPLQRIEFADGTVWNLAEIVLRSTPPNAPPVVAAALVDRVALEGSALSFTLPSGSFTDPNAGDTLTYSATLSNGSALPSWLSFNAGTRVFSGTPPTSALGTLSIRVTAKDSGNLSVFDDFNLAVNVENKTLTGGSGADVLTGYSGNDSLSGAGGNDTLIGAAGNDTLDGGTGNDSMSGGLGDDLYRVDSLTDVIVESSNEGTDLVQSSVTYTLATNVENLTLTGTSTISGTGNGLDNVLTGNSANNTLTGGGGNDTLDGGTGNDTMVGGTGNDTYVVNVTTDVVTELSGEGTDLVQSAVTYTLGNNVENLLLTGSSTISGTGNTLDNLLTGNSANNTLTGAGGNDTLDGGLGNDTLVGGTGDDTYVVNVTTDVITENASEGTDSVQSAVTWTLSTNLENLSLTGTGAINGTGNTSANVLTGNSGSNTLSGLAGADTLDGGAGNDTLNGGAGADLYLFGAGSGVDTVQDNDSTAGVKDRVQFGAGIAQTDLSYTKVGNNLVASINGTSDQLIVQDWYLGSQYHVEEFRFNDGSILTDSQVQGLVSAMAGFAAAPMIGASSPDVWRGGSPDRILAASSI